MNQGEHLDLAGIRCCASCAHFSGERKRHRLGECRLEAGMRGGTVRKAWATELCFRYSAARAEAKS